jgi:hypothetical protein
MRRARHVEASYAVSGIVGGATRRLCMGLQPPDPVVERQRIVLCVGNPDIVTTPTRQYSSLSCGGDIKLARSVLYLADETSINTTSIASRKLAISENVSSNGCR